MKKVVYVRSCDMHDLEKQVNEKMEEGYELHGPIVSYVDQNEYWDGQPSQVFVQALVNTQPN